MNEIENMNKKLGILILPDGSLLGFGNVNENTNKGVITKDDTHFMEFIKTISENEWFLEIGKQFNIEYGTYNYASFYQLLELMASKGLITCIKSNNLYLAYLPRKLTIQQRKLLEDNYILLKNLININDGIVGIFFDEEKKSNSEDEFSSLDEMFDKINIPHPIIDENSEGFKKLA